MVRAVEWEKEPEPVPVVYVRVSECQYSDPS